ncbi:MAG TPA: zinc-dependent peptidase [Chitinophagaceae bacterium]
MSDTTSLYYLVEGVPVAYDSLPDSLKQRVDEMRGYLETRQAEEELNPDAENSYKPFLFTMLFFVAIGTVMVRRAWKSKGITILGSYKQGESAERINELFKDYHVYPGQSLSFPIAQYEHILSKHLPYYRRLAPELKDEFLRRTRKFLADKTFLIKSDETFVEMPVLLSATAVQLTFGLPRYLLPHFRYIRIYKEEYFAADHSLRVLAGHVYGNTITVAWNRFLAGQEDYTDGSNLGLHEMAHALYFQLVEADSGRCRNFTAQFEKVLSEGEAVYEESQQHPSSLFSRNAYRNLQEFWAESVELFFERPNELRRENAGLCEVLKEILQQDPASELYPLSGSR